MLQTPVALMFLHEIVCKVDCNFEGFDLQSLSFIRTILLEHEGLKNFLNKNTQAQFRLKFIQKVF